MVFARVPPYAIGEVFNGTLAIGDTDLHKGGATLEELGQVGQGDSFS